VVRLLVIRGSNVSSVTARIRTQGGEGQVAVRIRSSSAQRTLARPLNTKNLTLSGGASVRQDWCSEFGSNGCTAVNITGGSVSMCP
jgi:hypothetical protein